METINNAERLSDVMPVALSLACCGGSLVHHQQEWIAFRKVRFNVFLPMNVVAAHKNPSDPHKRNGRKRVDVATVGAMLNLIKMMNAAADRRGGRPFS